MTPEARARQMIDALLMQAGWHVCNMSDANIHAARGVALGEFPLNFKFDEEYIVRHLQSNELDTTAGVTICTIWRLFSILKLLANIVALKFQRI